MGQNFAKIALGQNFRPQPTTNITSPSNGDMYYDSTRNTLVQYNNGVWQDSMSRSDVASAATLTSTNFSASVVQSSLVRITGSTSGSITGLTASADGKFVVLYNESSTSQIIDNQSGSESIAANRIICPGGTNLTIISGQAIILTYDGSQSRWVVLSIPATSSSSAPQYNVTSQTTAYNANINDYVICSGSSFVVTLPDSTTSGYKGQSITIEHNGTSLTQIYTLNTTSSQTINGPGGTISSGNYSLYTNGEVLQLISDGANWQIVQHKTFTGWTTVNSPVVTSTAAYTFTIPSASIAAGNTYTNNGNTYVTSAATVSSTSLSCYGGFGAVGSPSNTGATNFTIPSSSVTVGAVYEGAYTFTITAGNSASAGAVYSNNGNNYTLAITFGTGATTAVFTGPAAPTASGTLTYVSGTHTGGNLTFSAFNGDATTKTYTALKTVSTSTALYVTNNTSGPTDTSTGTIVLVSGTGPSTLTYTASAQGGELVYVSGGTTGNLFFSADSVSAPVKSVDISSDFMIWRRVGDSMEVKYVYAQNTAAGTAGTGDYLIPLPAGTLANNSAISPYGGAAATSGSFFPTNTLGSGNVFNLGAVGSIAVGVFMYDQSYFRLIGVVANNSPTGGFASFSSGDGYSNADIAVLANLIVPISGWQP